MPGQPATTQPPTTAPGFIPQPTGPTTPPAAAGAASSGIAGQPATGQAPAGGAAVGGSMPQMAPAPATGQVTDENRAMMLMLLDRIQKVTADQMKSDSSSGKLTVNRSQLDEILANVSQIKTMLQK
ncbi:MAG TPA: hypothetical protein VFA27_07875 [Vicinamibacterales bacterium]|nr:hypothetical protein [Vicinamibacterales bacterium]